MRKPVIAGNWKMHNTISESLELVKGIKPQVADVTDVEIIVSPVYTALASVSAELKGSNINVASQNIFWEEKGAFTGEIAPNMITDAGCTHAIIGHSERRQYFGETDETVNKRVKAALAAGNLPGISSALGVNQVLLGLPADDESQVMGERLSYPGAGGKTPIPDMNDPLSPCLGAL